MRKPLLILLALCLSAGFATAGDQEEWIDMANCDMCGSVAAKPEMMQKIDWSYYVIDGGMMSVCVVPDAYTEDWRAVRAAMHATGEKMMAGEKMQLCGLCTSMDQILHTDTAAMEVVETTAGEVTLITSTDAETIGMIHEHAKRLISELEKMAGASESG